MSVTDKEKDEFWDLDKIVPPRKTVISQFATRSQVVSHSVDGETDGKIPPADRKLSFDRTSTGAQIEESSYVPEKAGLIKRVTIKRQVDKYDFYGNFRKAALIYYDYKTSKCEFTPYYSYMPQYSQLNSQQKNYYFYWRDEVRKGKFIKCDYSYLYLYVYEILNLPDMIEPELGIKLLCRIWREYRKSLPRIDAYFSVWVQDYCFIHNLPCPLNEIRDFIFDVIAGSDFKEFYLSDATGAEGDGTEALIVYLSDYDFHTTRYAEGDNAAIFSNHMLGAMKCVLSEICGRGALLCKEETQTLRRDAFPHSLCTHAVKCKLEIEFIPLAKDDSLRRSVTAAVRYTENKLRALFGVKSRLGIKDLPDIARRIIDVYFENIYEIERRRKERECAPEYEKLYEAEDKTLSFADADEIERASWSTTARLIVDDDCDVEADEAAALTEAPLAFESKKEIPITGDTPSVRPIMASPVIDALGLTDGDISLIRSLINGEDTIVSDEAFERINEAFISSDIGDIILEGDGEKYVLIDDYRADIEQWLSEL